mmetsp:Transcript_44/g.89  ORF Transcript_44/g.89 Transcript_44/m.89 type:complete len:500 (+) Transcript_44:83-1582(+)
MTQTKKKTKIKKKFEKKAPAEGAEAVKEEKKDIDEHPLANGHYLIVKYRDNSDRLVRIIERHGSLETGNLRYYIHYEDFNRRMDEWINIDRILKFPSEGNRLEKEKKKADEINQILNEDPPARKRQRSDLQSSSSLSGTVGMGKGKENSAPLQLDVDGKATVVVSDEVSGDHNIITTVSELEHDEHEGMDEMALKEHEEITKIKNISNVVFGRHEIECWYFSPFPKEYHPDGPVDFLYYCEFSMRFFRTKDELLRYQSKPGLQRHPPGNEIYRDENVSMFEVDGAVEKIYCQNLSYFAKLFLDHKTLYFDVDPFLFYVLCSQDERGYHPVGYFSKEKFSDAGYNLACILTFPHAQRKGYGRFLIAFSYELSKKEEKVGSPEKPLSDLGAVSYRSYWASELLVLLRNSPAQYLSIMDLAQLTSIVTEDVTATLQHLNLLRNINGTYIVWSPPAVIDELMKKYPVKPLLVNPEKLQWTPLYNVTDPTKDKWSIKAKKSSIE